MGHTFVIPDIHGRLDLLCEGLSGISRRSRDGGVIVALGDYVDKGPSSREVIDRLLAGVGAGFRLVTLKGNHDAMMIEAMRDASNMAHWLEKGGNDTLASYGGDIIDVPRTHLDWLNRLQLTHVDAHRVYVHAGIDPDVPLSQQSERTLLWKRYPKGLSDGFGTLHVVHGHDNCPDGPLLYQGRTNLDTLAWRTGRLTIGVFDDDRAGGPIDFITINGTPIVR